MHKNGAIVRTLDQELIIAVTVTKVGVQSEAEVVDMIWQPPLDEAVEAFGGLSGSRRYTKPEQQPYPTHDVSLRKVGV
jgi:hypothetical protein